MIGIKTSGTRDGMATREKRKERKAIMDSNKHYWCRQREAQVQSS